MSETVTQVVLDRWEDGKAVLEGLGTVPAGLLPTGAREGDVFTLRITEDSTTLTLDPEERRRREAEAKSLRESLERVEEPEGDFEL